MGTHVDQQALALVAEPGPGVPKLQRMLLTAMQHLHCRPEERMAGDLRGRLVVAKRPAGRHKLARVDWLPAPPWPAALALRSLAGLQCQVRAAAALASIGRTVLLLVVTMILSIVLLAPEFLDDRAVMLVLVILDAVLRLPRCCIRCWLARRQEAEERWGGGSTPRRGACLLSLRHDGPP